MQTCHWRGGHPKISCSGNTASEEDTYNLGKGVKDYGENTSVRGKSAYKSVWGGGIG